MFESQTNKDTAIASGTSSSIILHLFSDKPFNTGLYVYVLNCSHLW